MIEIYGGEGSTAAAMRAAEAAFAKFGLDKRSADLEITFVTAEEIRELNRDTRNVDAVTDVLSFPALKVKLPFSPDDYQPSDLNPETGAVILGEIAICTERAREQAEEYGHSLTREIAFLTVHGTLHILGYDHETEGDRAEMEALQEEILSGAGLTREVKDEDIAPSTAPFKTAYIAVLGRPNAGKSTLVNTLVGEKVSIVSWKPQTTRNRILGIRNDVDSQLVFIDTPGLHAPRNALGKFMMRSVTSALSEVTAVLYVVDAEKGLSDEDKDNIVRYIGAEKKVVIAVNKLDHVTREKIGEILTALNEIKGYQTVVPISALRGKNIPALVAELKKLATEGDANYPSDEYTDRPMRFMAAEIIREKAFRLLDKEIPYGVGVSINKFEFSEDGVCIIDAEIICQKQAHKPIILGKGGEMIKRIATYARQDLENMTGAKVFITIWVRVKPDWRDDTAVLGELGYDKPEV